MYNSTEESTTTTTTTTASTKDEMNNDRNQSDYEHGYCEEESLLVNKSYSNYNNNINKDDSEDDDDYLDSDDEKGLLSFWEITCILSTAFGYGCIMTTLFLITLPVECERIEEQHKNVPKSVALGIFVSIAGLTQLISPLVGMLSDTYKPPIHHELGQRMPYLVLGSMFSLFGLLGQYIYSFERLWLRYGIFFFLHMIGLNITYAMMIALIPDQVPKTQTGVANGMLAFMLVTGSLFGFGLFHYFFQRNIQNMYGLYICIVVVTTILTALYGHDRDAKLTAKRIVLITEDVEEDQSSPPLPSPPLNTRTKKLSRKEKRKRFRKKLLRLLRLEQKTPGLLTPYFLFRSMLYDPLIKLDSKTLFASYTIDTNKYHDFFIVTISRLFYYCGMSVQTFFLYFLHDIIHVKDDPESAVAYLAILGQISGTFTTYPIGLISDSKLCNSRRKPFVYIACAILGSLVLCMTWATTMDQMVILCLILGSANGIYLTMDTSLAVDTLPQDYEDGPSGGNAQLLGIWGVAAFLGTALGPMIGGPLLYLVGSIPKTEEEEEDDDDTFIGDDKQAYSIRGYTVIMSLSAFYFLSSAIALRWVKNPNV